MASARITHRGSYERYKTRTNVFINWLLTTARTCCKLDSVVLALKGRAGENAKKNGREVLLTTREITTLCLKIAEKKRAKIPDWLLTLLKAIIDGRTIAAAFHSTLSAAEGSDVERSNAGHAHFIEVLQQAHDIFSSIDKSRIISRTKKAAASSTTPLGSQFVNLNMEDPSESQLDQDELDELAQNTTGINFRLEVDEEQELSSSSCVFSATRNWFARRSKRHSSSFVDGDVTLEVTCQAANIGFGIVRRACENFVSQRPSFENYSCMLDFLGLRMRRHEGLVVIQAEQVPKVQDLATSGGHQHRKPLVPLDDVTSSLLCVSGVAIMTGLYDASQCSSQSQVTHEIRHGFAKILHDALPELQRLDIRPSNLRPELGQWYSDEFAMGMVNFLFGGHSGLPKAPNRWWRYDV